MLYFKAGYTMRGVYCASSCCWWGITSPRDLVSARQANEPGLLMGTHSPFTFASEVSNCQGETQEAFRSFPANAARRKQINPNPLTPSRPVNKNTLARRWKGTHSCSRSVSKQTNAPFFAPLCLCLQLFLSVQ